MLENHELTKAVKTGTVFLSIHALKPTVLTVALLRPPSVACL